MHLRQTSPLADHANGMLCVPCLSACPPLCRGIITLAWYIRQVNESCQRLCWAGLAMGRLLMGAGALRMLVVL